MAMQFWKILTAPDTTAIVGFVLGVGVMIFWMLREARRNDSLTDEGREDEIYVRMNRRLFGDEDEPQ
jgi:hypothetical protein